MIEQKTIVRHLTWDAVNDALSVRLDKLIVRDGVPIAPPEPHRFILDKSEPHEAVIARVNAGIGKEGYPPISYGDIQSELARMSKGKPGQ